MVISKGVVNHGKLETREYSDFYIQDGIVTVHRDEKFRVDNTNYYPFKLHIPLANIISIEEIKR